MGLYDPILTSVGLLSAKKLTSAARDKYFEEVTTLLVVGNEGGHGLKGGLTSLFALPPVDPLPEIVNVTTLQKEKIFWFRADPFAAEQAAHIKTRANAPILHTIFLDTLLEGTANALDLAGSTPFAPVCDMSFAFGPDFPFPPKFPDDFIPKLGELKLTIPELTIPVLMAKLGIKFPPPIPPFAIPFPPPGIPPDLPTIPLPPPTLILPEFVTKLLELPFIVLKKLIIPPSLDLALKLPELPLKVFDLCFESLLGILTELNLLLITPKLLIACLLVYLKNVVGMIVTVIIGMLVGSGNFAKTGAKLCGLV